jgi:hypothetical protein
MTVDLICHDLGTTTDLLPDKFGGIGGGGMRQLAFSGRMEFPKKSMKCFFLESVFQVFQENAYTEDHLLYMMLS